MQVDLLEEAIAAVAHACWCKRMRAAGCRGGEQPVDTGHPHDAIGDYDKLTPFDREQIRECIRMEGLEEQLASAADTALRDPELSARQMRVGLPVRTDDAGIDPAEHEAKPIGRVVSWEVTNPETGRLGVIRVQWPDGAVVDYYAAERALVIAAEPI
jgi:hypothetical protein